MRNVARCWAYETSVCVDKDLPDDLPYNTEYFEYFSPDFSLHPEVSPRQENGNTRQYLDAIVQTTHDNLKMVAHAPSVQMQDTPRTSIIPEDHGNLDDIDPDVRAHDLEEERRVDHEAEFYDGDRDQDGEEDGAAGAEAGDLATAGGGASNGDEGGDRVLPAEGGAGGAAGGGNGGGGTGK